MLGTLRRHHALGVGNLCNLCNGAHRHRVVVVVVAILCVRINTQLAKCKLWFWLDKHWAHARHR